jgi:hypothetical protein
MSIFGGLLGDLISPVKDLVSEAITDKDKRAEINLKLAELEMRGDERLHEELLAQVEVNKLEATHRSLFVAGWRPFIGWTGGAGVAWTFLVSPLVEWISRLFGWTGTMPGIDATQLMTLVMAMLGVGAMRSYDKKHGTSNDVLTTPTPPAPVPTDIPPGFGDPLPIPAPAKRKKKSILPFDPPW